MFLLSNDSDASTPMAAVATQFSFAHLELRRFDSDISISVVSDELGKARLITPAL